MAHREYTARINRVVDHINTHLDHELTLEELARVACFSPYHFHRIFGAITGERLSQYIGRLRLLVVGHLCPGLQASLRGPRQ